MEGLLDRFASLGQRGVIEGPHGSGKSTLLLELVGQLRDRGLRVHLVRRPAGEPAWDVAREIRRPLQTARRGDVLAIDGYEQLAWWRQRLVEVATRARGLGLLATVHRAAWLPVLYRTEATPEILSVILHQLLGEDLGAGPRWESLARESHQARAARIERHQGNLREVLFELYDVAESRRSCDR